MVFYGIGQFLIAFIADIRYCLARLDAEIHLYSKRKQRISDVHLKQMFHETITFHTEIKQLSVARITIIFSILMRITFLLPELPITLARRIGLSF